MNHISEDDLILFHYGEPSSGDARTHLSECPECRERLQSLARVLDEVGAEAVPEPGPGYEELVWQRLRWQMRSRRGTDVRKFATAAAAAVLLIVGFTCGRFFHTRSVRETPTFSHAVAEKPSGSSGSSDSIALVASKHLDRSSRLLLDVANQSAGSSGDAAAQQAAAEQLLASNRVYRLMAARSGAAEVSSLLEEIEPILTELAHADRNLTPAELTSIQQRIHEREILFKLRVIQQTLQQHEAAARRQHAAATSSPMS